MRDVVVERRTALSQLALFATHAIEKDIPFNEGAVRPLAVIAPEGSLLNAREPAATSACTLCTGEAIVEAVKAGEASRAESLLANFRDAWR